MVRSEHAHASYPGLILVPRGRAPFGQHQESRPLAVSNNGSPRFTDFPSLCAHSESNLTNLIGSGLNLLCLQIHSKPECRWTWPEVAILGADQKERGLWGRECLSRKTAKDNRQTTALISHDLTRNNELAFSSTSNLQFYRFQTQKFFFLDFGFGRTDMNDISQKSDVK